jgi:hypothetical protein
LPEHVAVGDKVELSYGSNLKSYTFHVVRIRHEDDTCTFLSEASGAKEHGEKIEAGRCRPRATSAGEAR